MSGVDNRTRVRVAVVFGLFETAMPLIGLAIGHGAATYLGSATKDAGAALLVACAVRLHRRAFVQATHYACLHCLHQPR